MLQRFLEKVISTLTSDCAFTRRESNNYRAAMNTNQTFPIKVVRFIFMFKQQFKANELKIPSENKNISAVQSIPHTNHQALSEPMENIGNRNQDKVKYFFQNYSLFIFFASSLNILLHSV